MKPLALAANLLLSIFIGAQAAEAPNAAEATPAPKRTLLKFAAPKGVPTGGRIDGDGGSRGAEDKDKLPALYVLVPDQTALTTQEAPSLFWFQTGGANTRFELTLNEPKNPKPLLKVSSEKSEKPGIHRISLAKQNVSLKPGITYKWNVAWVPKADNRSLNVVAGGLIKRVEPEPKLTAELAHAKGVDLAGVYAQNGIWYDALEAISNSIEATPNDRELRRLRAGLLEQAGLKVAAEAERK
jgi:hypothetical protein